jgi:hypothetical protein
VDVIHTAIGGNAKINFQYFQCDIHKKMALRRNGDLYEVSSWALSWDEENCYLIAFDGGEEHEALFGDAGDFGAESEDEDDELELLEMNVLIWK